MPADAIIQIPNSRFNLRFIHNPNDTYKVKLIDFASSQVKDVADNVPRQVLIRFLNELSKRSITVKHKFDEGTKIVTKGTK